MQLKEFIGTLALLKREYPQWKAPVITFMAENHATPFRILISTVLSLRTKDETTTAASARLFAKVSTPGEMLSLPAKEIEKLIFPVGFYRVKARQILGICRTLLDQYEGEVPGRLDALLAMKGVGRKTANLVLAKGFNVPAICVDTHVHRISNRLGFVTTKTPEETEFALAAALPRRYWNRVNDLLVAFGQTLCRPVGPKCRLCRVRQCPSRREKFLAVTTAQKTPGRQKTR